jgi:hypothetical protein
LAAGVKFDWDEANTAHVAAHAVTPAEVEEVYLNDPMDLDFRVVGGEKGTQSLDTPIDCGS